METWRVASILGCLRIASLIVGLDCAAVQKHEVEQEGLYHRNDKVAILSHDNFEQEMYGQPHAWLVQFYNSHCGHCRSLAPRFKAFAADVAAWRGVVRVAVLDCARDDNVDHCRDFEVNAYPSMRYLHENYTRANGNIGEPVAAPQQTAPALAAALLAKLLDHQRSGRLAHAPPLHFFSYNTLTEAMSDVPSDTKYTFMIFDGANSTVGPMVSLDTSSYDHIAVKLVSGASPLAAEKNVDRFPALVAVRNDLQIIFLTPKTSDRDSIVRAINVFLESKNIPIPEKYTLPQSHSQEKHVVDQQTYRDEVRLEDLETALQTTLRQEFTRHKVTSGESLAALKHFVSVLVDYFPFVANGKTFMMNLKKKLDSSESVTGEQIEQWIKELTAAHEPVFASPLHYVNCVGSEPAFRGHTCGLWMMFHTLTVAAATQRSGNASDVLSAMHDYVKHFFACTECSNHFQQMAAKNNMTSIKNNEKAVLWLWIAHNEVNLRLAGDITEDPKHPKMQYPSAENCRDCRQSTGAWNLEAVYRYLRKVYAPEFLGTEHTRNTFGAPLSPLDLALSTALYICSFIILLLACKLLCFKTRRFLLSSRYSYRRQLHEH